MANGTSAPGPLRLGFPEPASFRATFDTEIARGHVFVPGASLAIGTVVALRIQVAGVGELDIAGRAAAAQVRPAGSGIVLQLDRSAEAVAKLRALYERCRAPAAAPDAKEARDLRPGEVLDGRFEIEEHLASGGMADVFRARHVYMKRRVALKLMNRALANDPAMAARFRREAELVSQLENPNIVRVFDFGCTTSGLLFLAMEFVDGVPLDKLIEDGNPLPPERAVALLAQVCDGLAEAHARGIVHRDLKPPNIMVARRPDGSDFPKILDFGIARLADEQSAKTPGVTRAGVVLGTPEYVSPEQALAAPLDPRSDQYSLGVVAYELLTGRRPFYAESLPKLLSMHVTQPPPPPARTNPALAAYPALGAALLKALRKEKDQRFADVTAFAAALKDALRQPQGDPARVGAEQQVCPFCSADVEPEAAFCGACGAALRCPSCGTPTVPGNAYCKRCGAAVKPEEELPPAALVPLEASAARHTPPALAQAVAALKLPKGRSEAILAAREPVAGPGQGAALAVELVGLSRVGEFASDPARAAAVARRCLAAVVETGADHGGVLDALGPDSALFLFDGAEPSAVAERAARAALCIRDAILDERRNLAKGAPLAARCGLAAGGFEAPEDGSAAHGEAVEGAHALSARATPGSVLADPLASDCCGARVDKRPTPDRSASELTAARPPPVPATVKTVGRDHELDAFDALLAQIGAGRARPFAVVGPAGSGKSKLAEELATRARRQGLAVAVARPRDGGLPLGALVSLVCELCGVPERGRFDKLGPALQTLKLPTGEVAAALVAAGAQPPPPQFGAGGAAAAVAALASAVAQARGVVLVFDDLDRADAATAEVYRLLCRRAPPRVLVAGFARPELPALPAEAWRLDLAPLPPADLAALATELLGGQVPPEDLLDLLSRRCGGVPELAVDWIQLLFERGFLRPQGGGFALSGTPPELAPGALAAARVRALPLGARTFLQAGALVGEVVDAATVESALAESRTTTGWSRLERGGLVRALGDRRYLIPARYRAAAAALGDEAARAGLHRRIAQALQGRVLDVDQAPPASDIARHNARAGEHAAALSWWRRAVEAAVARRDHLEAALRLDELAQALQPAATAGAVPPEQAATESVQLRARAASQAIAAGDTALAHRLVELAGSVLGAAPEATVERLFALARVQRVEGQPRLAADTLASAAAAHPGPALAALVALETGEQAEAAGDLYAARTAFESAIASAQAAAPLAPWHGEIDLRARAEARLAGVLQRLGDGAAATALYNRSLEAWRRLAHPAIEARVLASLAALAAQASRPVDAERLFTAALGAAERAGDLPFKARQLLNLAKLLRHRNDLAGARLQAGRAAELASALGWTEGATAAAAVVQ